MYEWLDREIASIKTKRFHVVEEPVGAAWADVEASGIDLPESYRGFVRRFGNAKLYRSLGYYSVGVLAPPRRAVKAGVEFYHIGHHDDAKAYFKANELRGGSEAPVYEAGGSGLRRVSEGFEDWLRNRCETTRRRIGRKKWTEVVAGPRPFDDAERKIVDARRDFQWRVLGVSGNGDHRIEVTNKSSMRLPFLSIGVRTKTRSVVGGVWLPVADLAPGSGKVVERGCYESQASPEELEFFDLPDPEPEDRERYWEFRKT